MPGQGKYRQPDTFKPINNGLFYRHKIKSPPAGGGTFFCLSQSRTILNKLY